MKWMTCKALCILKKLKILIKNIPTRNYTGFSGECYKIFMEEVIQIQYKLFQKTEKEEILPGPHHSDTKPETDITRKL
jgi:hypothetical protein